MSDYHANTPLQSTSAPSSSREVHSTPSKLRDDAVGNNRPGSIRDNLRLADLGYRPELKRDFSALETFGVAFSIMYVLSLVLEETLLWA
jgi:hypothetical protein